MLLPLRHQDTRERSLELEGDLSDQDVPQARADMVIIQRARFQYKPFLGKPKEDPDEWLEDFIGTAQANGEDSIKLTTLAGVLRGEARPWFNGLAADIKGNWDFFKAAFLLEFRKVEEETEALIKIGQMRMNGEESVRRFLQRFQRVAKKIDPPPANSMLMSWFVSSLPRKMGISVRQARPTTLEEAVEAAMSYRSADISSSKSRKKKKKYESSFEESSDQSSSEDSDSSSSSEDSSNSEEDSSSDEESDKAKKKKKKCAPPYSVPELSIRANQLQPASVRSRKPVEDTSRHRSIWLFNINKPKPKEIVPFKNK